MTKFLAVCCIAVFAGFAVQTFAQEKQALRLVQTIPLPGVTGRLDHMGVDLEKKRLFVAAASQAIGDQEAAILVFEPVPSEFLRSVQHQVHRRNGHGRSR